MINKVENKYWRITHKYGKLTPKTIDEALRLDKEDGTNLWFTTIQKEMNKRKVELDLSELKCVVIDEADFFFAKKEEIEAIQEFDKKYI